MSQRQGFIFHSFRLDPVSGCLWRGTRVIPLRPKTFAVLRYLVEHAGQLVTKEDLLDAVWTGTYVSSSVPIVCIRELRQALGDTASAPRFIQAVPRRGYRFIAKVHSAEPGTPPLRLPRDRQRESRVPRHSGFAMPLVGREGELKQLHGWLAKAARGERQFVFVTGEPGIGKTTLLDAFVEEVASYGEAWIGRGLCVEHYGAGEAYLPILDAFGRMCRGPTGRALIGLLGQHAPTWLVQIPTLLTAAELDALQHRIQGATRERMLREMAEAVEALTAEKPLVFVLEDLQWGDYSTLDLIAYLARRREQARLLLLGTYRPMEVIGGGHPLRAMKQELQAHGQCQELPLGLLAEGAVEEYLATRFAVRTHSRTPRQKLASVIHQRTDGNPLFMINVVDYLVARGLIQHTGGQWDLQADTAIEAVTTGVPENLRQLIEKHIEKLSPEEQRLLEAASVAGVECSVASLAAGLGGEVLQVERLCAALARRDQFLRGCGIEEWPDGTVTGRYRFIHALYQNVLYERLATGQRLYLHRQIGERKETGYGDRAGEIAGELAMHFEQGRDYRRAVPYLQQAAENALQRRGYREAIRQVSKGLELLKMLPETPERHAQELTLQVILGSSLFIIKGYAAPETERVYTRALELCQRERESPHLFLVLVGLCNVHLLQGRLQIAYEVGEQLLSLAQREQDPAFLVWAHGMLGIALTHMGERSRAQAHLEQASTFHVPQMHDPAIGVACLSYLAFVLLELGYADQASGKVQQALTLAETRLDPFSRVYASVQASLFHYSLRDSELAQKCAEEAIALASEQGFAHWLAVGTIARGAALVEQGQGEEGITQMRQGLIAYRATGAQTALSMFLALLAEAYGRAGQTEEGLKTLAEAAEAAQRIGEHGYEAELYRLQGELLLQSGQVNNKSRTSRGQVKNKSTTSQDKSEERNLAEDAEACFCKAVEIARQQSAKLLELRAAMRLSRLWQQRGKREEARQLVTEIYDWFTEGFDTGDLQEAKALIEELRA